MANERDKKVMLYSLVHLVASLSVDSLMTWSHIDVFEILCVKRLQNEHTKLNRLIPMLLFFVILLYSIAVSLWNRFALPSMDCYFSFYNSLCDFQTRYIKIYCDVLFLFWPSHIVYHAVRCRLLFGFYLLFFLLFIFINAMRWFALLFYCK